MGLGRLIFSELRYGYAPWLAVLAVSIVSAACVHLTMALVMVGASSSNRDIGTIYGNLGGVILTLAVPTAMIAVSITGSLCVRLFSTAVAKWQLAGVVPRLTGWVVRCELLIVCGIGSVVGVALGYVAWPWFVDLATESSMPDTPALHAPPPFVAAFWTIIIVVAIGYLSAGRAVRRTRRIEPIAVLRTADADERTVGPLRVIVAVILGSGLIAALVAIALQDTPRNYDTLMMLATLYIPFGMAMLAVVVVLGPLLFGACMALWTAVIPARWSVSWYLARNSARSHLAYSSGVITPLLVAASSIGMVYTWIDFARNAAVAVGGDFRGSGTPLDQMVLMFGSPVLIAVVATAGVIFASARGKERETALLLVGGATRGPIIVKSVLESVIYVVTTVLLALIVSATANAAYTVALRSGPIPAVAMPAPPMVLVAIAGGGLIFILAATLIPVLQSLRANTMAVLRSE